MIKTSLVALTLVTALASTAHADLLYGQGAQCTPAFGSQSFVGTGEPGIANYVATSEARVFCSLQRDVIDANRQVRANEIQIRYSDSSSVTPMWCYGYATNGNTWWSGTKYTCSGYGGCPDPTTSFTGSGTLRWANPFNNLVTNGFWTYGFSCNLPRTQNGAASWLQSFFAYLTTI